MQSFGYPASSIHLGRGDNWRISGDEKFSAGKWAANVCAYFDAGIEALRIGGVLRIHVTPKGDLCELTSLREGFQPFDVYIKEEIVKKGNYSAEISRIFLESLTFEESFVNRITKTLSTLLTQPK